MRAVDEKHGIMTCCGLTVMQLHLLMFVLGFKTHCMTLKKLNPFWAKLKDAVV